MTYFPLTDAQAEWRDRARAIAADTLAPHAAAVDRAGEFPSRQLAALREAGLFGLRAHPDHGGLGEGLLTFVLVTEELAKACPSTALIYKMHLESIEMISRVPTPEQAERIVPRLASGEWISTVAGSEAGHRGGAWAGGPKSEVRRVEGGYDVRHIHKSFVTAAGLADAYFFMTSLEEDGQKPRPLMFQVLRDDLDWTIDEPWDGLGMRGNQSSPMTFNGFIPEARQLNPEGAPVDLMPVVLGSYAAVYLGIAAGCFDLLHAHVAQSELADGRPMCEVETIQRKMAEAQVEIERSRALLHLAAAAFDAGTHPGPRPFFEAKVACDTVATLVTAEAMTLGGGTAYARRLPFERYFRDARAGMVMGIAHDIALLNIGRLLFPKEKKRERPS